MPSQAGGASSLYSATFSPVEAEAAHLVGARSAADAVGGLEHDRGQAPFAQTLRAGEARHAPADDEDVRDVTRVDDDRHLVIAGRRDPCRT